MFVDIRQKAAILDRPHNNTLRAIDDFAKDSTAMNSRSLATKDSPNLVDGEALLRRKPVLFVHIPKTAGSSFLMVPRNVFGDHRVRRLRGGADETTQTEIDRVVSDEIQDIDCLAAHSPIHMFAKYLDS